MFADGTLYAAVARNMALGKGSFWHPHLAVSMHDHFHEQPPLGLFLQSLFFHVFSGIYPERVYELVMLFVDGWLMARIWRNWFGEKENLRSSYSWPLLLFILSPVVFWAFANNVLETTMMAFAMAATDRLITGLVHGKRFALNILLAGLFTLGASLCKGPQGMFAICFPAILWICRRQVSFGRALGATAIMGTVIGVFYAVVLTNAHTQETFVSWYRSRIVVTFGGTHNTSGSHFALLYDLLLDLIPPLLIAGIFFLAGKNRAAAEDNVRPQATALFLLALSGSLPLMVTLEQRPFYLTTSIPFYALALAAWTRPYFNAAMRRSEKRAGLWKFTGVFSILLIAGVITATVLMAGTPKRDAGLLHDMRITAEMIGEGNNAGCDKATYENWGAVNYFIRYKNILLNPNYKLEGTRYYLSTTPEGPEGWKPVSFDRQHFYMFVRP